MALSTITALAQIRDLIAEITGIQRVYSPSETDANAIPPSLTEFPCVIVNKGPDQEYILTVGQHRHTYLVTIQIFESGPDLGARSASVLPYLDALLEKFVGNVTLGGRVNHCIRLSNGDGGLVGLDYGGTLYTGYQITFQISEQAAATPAAGS